MAGFTSILEVNSQIRTTSLHGLGGIHGIAAVLDHNDKMRELMRRGKER